MKATNFVKASYQEVYDIMTKDGKVSIFGFHTPVGLAPYRMLSGFFRQFKKYKYSGMTATLIPAAQLPADPLQISYAAGTENYIDPRDLQNPILFHGAHGNNLGAALNRIYSERSGWFAKGTSADLKELPSDLPYYNEKNEDGTAVVYDGPTLEEWYYSAMLDPSFRKFNVMNNIKLPPMAPRIHNLATNLRIQSVYDDIRQVDPVIDRTGGFANPSADQAYSTGQFENFNPVVPEDFYTGSGTGNVDGYIVRSEAPAIKIMSSNTRKLGWLDTFTFDKELELSGTLVKQPRISPLPKLMMGVLIMPPSYRVQLCFRMIITHYFQFAGFNTAITTPNFVPENDQVTVDQYNENYHDWLPDTITASASATALSDTIDAIDGEVKQTVSGVF